MSAEYDPDPFLLNCWCPFCQAPTDQQPLTISDESNRDVWYCTECSKTYSTTH